MVRSLGDSVAISVPVCVTMTVSPNHLHEQLLQLSGNLVLREITDLLYYRTARVWLALLPNVDWKEALRTLESEIADTMRALELGDLKGVGNVRRQHLYTLLKTIGRYLVGD